MKLPQKVTKVWKWNSWGQMRIRWGNTEWWFCFESKREFSKHSGGNFVMFLGVQWVLSAQGQWQRYNSLLWLHPDAGCLSGDMVSRTDPHTSFESFDVFVILLKPWKTKILDYKSSTLKFNVWVTQQPHDLVIAGFDGLFSGIYLISLQLSWLLGKKNAVIFNSKWHWICRQDSFCCQQEQD